VYEYLCLYCVSEKKCPYIDLLGLGLGPVHSPSISSHLVSHGSVKLKGILFSEN
jgi:hypothetical protein